MIPEFKNGIRLNNGKVLEAEKISELTTYVINKFADEKLSLDEANFVIKNIKDSINECAIVQKVTSVL